MKIELPKLYPITDARLTGLSHAEQVRRLCAGGAELVQIREKELSPKEFYKAAGEALEVARACGARVIINDRADLALALGADGVHLGQDDLPPEAARQLLGENAIIGFSTHTLDQAKRAAEFPVDYIAVGPIFPTSSKINPDPVLGLEGLRAIRETLPNVCLVAIGGIRQELMLDVLEAGADSVAVISALLEDPAMIEARTRQMRASILAQSP